MIQSALASTQEAVCTILSRESINEYVELLDGFFGIGATAFWIGHIVPSAPMNFLESVGVERSFVFLITFVSYKTSSPSAKSFSLINIRFAIMFLYL